MGQHDSQVFKRKEYHLCKFPTSIVQEFLRFLVDGIHDELNGVHQPLPHELIEVIFKNKC